MVRYLTYTMVGFSSDMYLTPKGRIRMPQNSRIRFKYSDIHSITTIHFDIKKMNCDKHFFEFVTVWVTSLNQHRRMWYKKAPPWQFILKIDEDFGT